MYGATGAIDASALPSDSLIRSIPCRHQSENHGRYYDYRDSDQHERRMSTKHSRHGASPFIWDGRLSLAPVVAVCPEFEKLESNLVLRIAQSRRVWRTVRHPWPWLHSTVILGSLNLVPQLQWMVPVTNLRVSR